MNQPKLTMPKGNAKLDKRITTFSLPAGWTCPGAKICKSRVVIRDGRAKVRDGESTEFRCFAASQEAMYRQVYNSRRRNLQMLLKCANRTEMAELIERSMPKSETGIMRIHPSGDFFNQAYFDAWLLVAQRKPSWTFYAYTKSLPYWIKRLDLVPDNFILTASFGGMHDDLIHEHRLKHAVVVYSQEQAAEYDYDIDHDDSLALTPNVSFALLLHGVQPKNTEAAAALVQLKKKGITGYSRR